MKHVFLFLTCILLSTTSFSQVGIGTETPNASAALDLTSTTQGLLPPRMTAAQRNAIASPAQGLMIYCTNCGTNGEAQFYNGAAWVNLVGGVAAASPAPFACGAFVAESDFKTFACHNLGTTDTSLDPHIPVQAIHGNYYQWGSSTVVADASTHAAAIVGWNTTPAANDSWLDESKTANDPCPTGFRVPTQAQWDAVIANNTLSFTGSWLNDATNFGSAIHFGPSLTLPAAGYREKSDGALSNRGEWGVYWISTKSVHNNNDVGYFYFDEYSASTSFDDSTFGQSVRCVSE